MIPKKINYIWLGGKKKKNLTNICINSWREILNDYEIIEWNEDNLNLNQLCAENQFLAECRKRKLWAFMADYLRLYILYNFGGIYFDVDVQVLKPFDDFLDNKVFFGYEYFTQDEIDGRKIGTGIIGCEPGNETIKRCLEFYDKQIWECTIYTIPEVLTAIIEQENSNKYKVYSVEYFAPYDYRKEFSYECIEPVTHAIHWFDNSWSENKHVRLFLQTKHIKNPIKRKKEQLRNYVAYIYHKYIIKHA